MNAFNSFRLGLARSIMNLGTNSADASRALSELMAARESSTEVGILMTPDVAMQLSAVYSCVRVLSEDMAKLPLLVYRRLPKGKERATDHWLTRLLDQPNQWQTGFEFREMQQAHIELCGNFYAIKTVVKNEVRELLPVPPTRIKTELQKDWTLKYTMTFDDGTQQVVPNALMYHVRGLTLNGIIGLSPVGYQRETIGFGVALRTYGSHMFKNGANVGGVLEHPGEMSDKAWHRLKESFDERYAGLGNAFKALLLEEGTKFTVTGMKADEAQFLQSRKYSRSEIAGIYRVPPHLIGDLDRATFSNIEQQSLDYVQNGLLGRARRLEARMAMTLLSTSDRDTIFIEHLLDGLLRGDFQTRMRGYQTAILSGWMNRNEVRSLENLNPGPADLDEYLAPLNMATADKINPTEEEQVPDKGTIPNDNSSDPNLDNRKRLHAI